VRQDKNARRKRPTRIVSRQLTPDDLRGSFVAGVAFLKSRESASITKFQTTSDINFIRQPDVDNAG
jgi:hypothetical protein